MARKINGNPIVDYDTFIELDGLDLHDYMEPLLLNPKTLVTINTLNRLLTELPKYDEYHLVYALEIGAKHSPETFSLHVPQYLVHGKASVWSATLRILDTLPSKYLTQEFIDSVFEFIALHPEKEQVAEALSTLEKRIMKGDPEKGSGVFY